VRAKKQKSIWSIPSIKSIKPVSNFTDADFFRRLVASEEVAPPGDLRFVIARINTLANNLPLLSPANQTGQLSHIAALCERAAVDLTIPASRIQRKDAKPPRRRKGTRP
jgi:hypothetical protein